MNVNKEVMVHSHPRSGLHLMLLGLYMIYGGDTTKPYEEVWQKTDKMPSHRHFFVSGEALGNTDIQVELEGLGSFDVDDAGILSQSSSGWLTPYNKHILLLRDYRVLASTSPPGKLDETRARLEASCTNYQYTPAGPYGLNGGYAKQIKDFDTQLPGKEKLVVYYEDLIKDGEAFRKIVSFIGKKEHALTEDYDFKELRSKASEYYRASGHTPSQKIEVSNVQAKRLEGKYEMILGTPMLEKYLGRYSS